MSITFISNFILTDITFLISDSTCTTEESPYRMTSVYTYIPLQTVLDFNEFSGKIIT
jgi:hypothetical protein